MVALTGVEPANRQFSSAQLGLSGCRFSIVGIPGCSETPPRSADVTAQSQRRRVAWAELAAELILAFTVAGENRRHRRWQLDPARLLRLGAFENQPIPGLAERPIDEGSTVPDVGPPQRHHLTAAASGG